MQTGSNHLQNWNVFKTELSPRLKIQFQKYFDNMYRQACVICLIIFIKLELNPTRSQWVKCPNTAGSLTAKEKRSKANIFEA